MLPPWPPNYIPSTEEWNAAFAAGAVNRGFVATNPCQLKTQTVYGIDTGIGPITAILPPLAGTNPGDWIALYDLDYSAAVNPVTFQATGTDGIGLYNQISPSIIANVSDFSIIFVSNTPAYWRAIVRLL